MNNIIEDLGKAGIIVADWDINKKYPYKTFTVDYSTWISYISRKPVPAGIKITNINYWKPVIKPSEEMRLWLQDIDNKINSFLESIGGTAFSVKFGDSNLVGICQKALTEAFDGEDLCVVDEKYIRFSDKDYNTDIKNGLGRVYLRKNPTYIYAPWVSIRVNGTVYLMYYDKTTDIMYGIYDENTNKGLILLNNLVAEKEDYNISELPEEVQGNYLNYIENENGYSVSLPDESTITSVELNQTRVYRYEDGKTTMVNILTQSMITKANTIYHIQYDYDLDGQTITIPERCILEFDGGNISNGTIKLNKCNVINNGLPCFDNIVFERNSDEDSKGYVARTSWFDWSENTADKFEKLIETVRYNGTLVIDTAVIEFSRFLSLGKLTACKIIGEYQQGKRYSTPILKLDYYYQPNVSGGAFITFNGDANVIENVTFDVSNNNGRYNISIFDLDTPSATASDLDVKFKKCNFSGQGVSPHIKAKGRGCEISECMFVTLAAPGGVDCCIEIEGKYRGGEEHWLHNSATSMRRIWIYNNSFHTLYGAHILKLKQDTGNANTTFFNVIISGNNCDAGCCGIECTSKINGLEIVGNTFYASTLNKRRFCNFSNDVSNFVFSKNTILGSPILLYSCYGDILIEHFEEVKKVENIVIEGNTYDCDFYECLFKVDSVDVDDRCVVKNLVVKNNVMSERTFEHTATITQTLSLVRLKYTCALNVNVNDNCVIPYDDRVVYPIFAEGQSVSDRYYKNVLAAFNQGCTNEITGWTGNKTNVVTQADIVNQE